MLITDSDALRHFCDTLREAPYLAVDTEFVREKTYYPKLCLVQVAAPDRAAAIDVLSPGIELEPLYERFADRESVKVFHSASQDLGILLAEMGQLPAPIFDTQIAAAFCGFGEQVAYATLAEQIDGAAIDKTSQLTDWARRPLTERQLDYALSDVVHLGPIYEHLTDELDRHGRAEWAALEIDRIADPALYVAEPTEQWRRIRLRRPKRRALAVLREIAAWREQRAQSRNLPRNWVIKDEALAEIAGNPPRDAAALERVRGVNERFAAGREGRELLAAVEAGLALGDEDWPALPSPRPRAGRETLVTLLQALLRARADEHGVAGPIVASRTDLERIAEDDAADVPALSGWRREMFGDDALALKAGRLALAASGTGVEVIRLPEAAAHTASPV